MRTRKLFDLISICINFEFFFFFNENFDALLSVNFDIGYFNFCSYLLNMQRSHLDLIFFFQEKMCYIWDH